MRYTSFTKIGRFLKNVLVLRLSCSLISSTKFNVIFEYTAKHRHVNTFEVFHNRIYWYPILNTVTIESLQIRKGWKICQYGKRHCVYFTINMFQSRMREQLRQTIALANQWLKGRILVADEGINGTVSGDYETTQNIWTMFTLSSIWKTYGLKSDEESWASSSRRCSRSLQKRNSYTLV